MNHIEPIDTPVAPTDLAVVVTPAVPFTLALFSASFQRWYDVLYAAAAKSLGADDAEDAVQESFIALHRRWTVRGLDMPDRGTDPLKAIGKLLCWMLARQVRSIRRRQFRQGRLFEPLPIQEEHEDEEGATAEDPAASPELVDVEMDAAYLLSRLPAQVREVYRCVCEHGMTAAETSACLGIHPATVPVYVSMAKRALRKGLDLAPDKAPRPPKAGDTQERTANA
ncbi:MAG: hypothetical protein NVS9B3_00950 [Gemmatimonadaceae bacterium]